MLRTIVLFICLFCFKAILAQSKHLYGVVSSTGDTSFWYKYQLKQFDKLSLIHLDTFSTCEYYRIWTNKQTIEILKNSNGTISGNIITWTDEYLPTNKKQKNRSFITNNIIETYTLKFIKHLIDSSNILNIPSDDSIQGWQHGFDGIEYIIEYANKNQYTFKTYWTPNAQDSIKEAKQIQEFINVLLKSSNAEEIWKEFSKKIPYECYINGGPGIICKILTMKDHNKYLKGRKKYLRQDKINTIKLK